MTDRNELLKALRPEILYDTTLEDNNLVGQFQNEVLRPILKFQNPILVAAFRKNVERRKTKIDKENTDEFRKFIQSSLKKDLAFKGYLIGIIIGQFLENEFEFYLENQKMVNKRITSMLQERLVDQLSN